MTVMGVRGGPVRARCAWGLVVALGLSLAAPRSAQAAWWDDLEAKAEGWKRRIREALERLDAAAERARTRLGALERERLEALRALFREQAEALEALLGDEKEAWGAVLAARSEELLRLIEGTSTDLERILAGTRDHFRDELSRLATGTRGLLERAARRAGARLGAVQIIDGHVVARHLERAQRRSLRLAGGIAGVLGGLVLLMGVVVLFHRSWVTGSLSTAIGLALAGFSLYVFLGSADPPGPRLGDEHCPALAAPQPRRAALIRCRVLAYDEALAQAVERRLNRMN